MVKGTGIGTLLGTMPYMAPEQIEGRDVDARSDIFSLGAVIYEMVTGQRAFKGDSPASVIGAILKDEPAPIASVTAGAAALDHRRDDLPRQRSRRALAIGRRHRARVEVDCPHAREHNTRGGPDDQTSGPARSNRRSRGSGAGRRHGLVDATANRRWGVDSVPRASSPPMHTSSACTLEHQHPPVRHFAGWSSTRLRGGTCRRTGAVLENVE